ncbi:MAG: DUF2764 family protein [Kiritimatiellae bacterium]|nr:DUF2764 family protein [Kiritimatiellia bacterium]
MNLEYFIASLPMLAPGQAPGISTESFRAACEAQLDPALGAAACALLDGRPGPHPFALQWQDRETILRNAVARRRASRHGTDALSAQHPAAGSDVRIEHGVAAAFEQTDPLQRERALNRLRWNVLEELQGNQPMAPEVVLAYAVKLRLLDRWSRLNADAGAARLERLTALPAGQ